MARIFSFSIFLFFAEFCFGEGKIKKKRKQKKNFNKQTEQSRASIIMGACVKVLCEVHLKKGKSNCLNKFKYVNKRTV